MRECNCPPNIVQCAHLGDSIVVLSDDVNRFQEGVNAHTCGNPFSSFTPGGFAVHRGTPTPCDRGNCRAACVECIACDYDIPTLEGARHVFDVQVEKMLNE